MPEDNKFVTADASTKPVAASATSHKKLWLIIGGLIFILLVVPGIIMSASLGWFSRHNPDESNVRKSVEESTGSQIEANKNGGYTVKDKNGNEYQVGGTQNYADDFPTDVPKYPNGKVTSAVRSHTDAINYWTNTVETADSADEVGAFFNDKLAAWVKQTESNAGNGKTLTYKKDKETLVLTFGESSGKTIINYGVSKAN